MSKQWVYTRRPDGEVTEQNYTLEETPVPVLENSGDVLIKSLYFSVDPYMRIQQSSKDTWEKPFPVGEVQGGGAVCEVIESKDPALAKGDIVATYTGWRQYAVCKAEACRKLDTTAWEGAGIPYSYALGVLGMPGRTAYFGFLEAGKPQAGETLVVSGAAGAVGSIVVQIGKIKGCKVVGIAGSPEKCAVLKALGCDATINYKEHSDQEKMVKALEVATEGKGVDIYYDNVGGYITDAIFDSMNLRARIIICGQISQYNTGLDEPNVGPRFLHKMLYKRATIQGILARDYNDRMDEMLKDMFVWLKEKKIQYNVTEWEGFEKLPEALNALFYGKNTGKMVVKV